MRDAGGALWLMPLCCMQVSGLKSVVEMRGCAGRLEMATISQSPLYSDSIQSTYFFNDFYNYCQCVSAATLLSSRTCLEQ